MTKSGWPSLASGWVLVPKMRQLQSSRQPSQITASCIFRPLNHVPSSIDSFKTSVPQLPQIALFSFSFGGLLISSGRPQ